MTDIAGAPSLIVDDASKLQRMRTLEERSAGFGKNGLPPLGSPYNSEHVDQAWNISDPNKIERAPK